VARYSLFIFSDCKDPSREQEFNDWYSNVHLPDMLEVQGMISATRWMTPENRKGMKRKYLAIYEVQTDNLEEFDKKVRERGIWTMKAGRFSDLPEFDGENIPRAYKMIMPAKYPGQTKP